MIRSLRAFFLARLLREKILLIGLAFVVVLFWFSSWSGRLAVFWGEQRSTTSELSIQSQWLTNRKSIEAAGVAAASQLVAAQTLDATGLVAAVNGLATEAGISSFNVGESQDVGNGQFVVHTVPLQVNKVTWEVLLPFYVNLQHKAPYISIETMSLLADRSNPKLLNASLRISSVQIVHTGS